MQPPAGIPANAALANGQITTRLRINLAGVQPTQADPQLPQQLNGIPLQTLQSQIIGGTLIPQSQQATISTNFINGQFSPAQRFLAQQLVGTQAQPTQFSPASTISTSPLVFPQSPPSAQPSPTSFLDLGDPANVQYFDGSSIENTNHIVFKRNENVRKRRVKVRRLHKRETIDTKNNKKRALVALNDGSVIDDKDLAENPFLFDGLSQFGAVDYQENLSKHSSIEDEIREHDREPAEDEVRAVFELCSACTIEPFQGAVILAWKDAKIHTEHALRGHSLGGCGDF